MTYSKAIQTALNKAKVSIGDRVSVAEKEGLLMPSPEITASPDHIVLKLDNGYNIGIKYEGQVIARSAKPEPKAIAKEAKYELGSHAKVKQPATGGKRIALLVVGGTITSKVDYSTGAVSTAMNGDDLVALVPELAGIAHFDMEQVCAKMSEDLTHEDWAKISDAAVHAVNGGADGVIVTHGTDVLHYTSAALSFMLDTPKPVIVVGAQRSSDRGSADSPMNLICAAHAALSDFSGVAVCMHGTSSDDYCLLIKGTKVRKMHSSMRNAFRPINDYPIAKIWPDGKIEPIRPVGKRGPGQARADTKYESRIALVKIHPEADPEVLDYYVKKGVKGIVIEGTGLGHVPTKSEKSWIPHVKAAVDAGVAVVISTQTIYGTVNPDVYTNLRILFDTGAIPSMDMQTETALVKLGWVLAHAKRGEVRVMMLKDLKGEFNQNLEPDMFLY